MNKFKLLSNFFLTANLALLLIIISIKFTVHFKLLYYFDINHLNIPKESGFNINEIKINYNYLIDFITSKSNINFKIPTLPFSQEGRIHFYEVKHIFMKIDYLFYISSIIGLITLYYLIKHKNFSILKYSSITLLTIPILLFSTLFVNFDNAFTLFHKIFFNNDYWIFDVEKDPIIKILPEEFFLHCAILINILIVFFSMLCWIIYKRSSK